MKTSRHIITTFLVATVFIVTESRSQELKDLIRKASPEHPRLFLERGGEAAVRKRIDSDATLRKASSHVIAVADRLQDIEPVERKKIGRRLLSVSRTCLQRVTHLAFAYRMTGDKRYAVRAQKEMMATAGFSDWNPSHFLDVGEMTAALAIGYDWVYPALDPEARKKIKAAIIEKGLRTSLKGGWWVRTENNWNQVCHGGLTLGALAVMEDEPDLARQIIERAVANVPRAMTEYDPDGAYPEGPGYWKYGTTYNVVIISALESVLGTDFGLSKAKGFLESADYYMHVTGPTGLYFNYSDCGSGGGVSPAMYWFAARRSDSSLLWRERQALDEFLAKKHGSIGSSGRLFPFLIIWAGEFDKTPIPKLNHWKADGKTPVSMHRSGWKTPGEVFVGVKAGSPSANHAHMDIGSFVMDAGGVRWALDLGSQSYHSLESKGISLWGKSQNAQRWDVFRLNSFSHNTLVVDGKKQVVSGKAPIIAFSDGGPMPHTIIEMKSVYKGQLAAAHRGVGLCRNRSVLVQDEIITLDRETTVRWGMVTRAKVEIKGDGTAVLEQGDQQLAFRVLSPDKAKLELFETAKPPAEYDVANTGTGMIGFKVKLPPSTETKLVVLLQPGDFGENPPAIVPLAEW
ncbi:MAG: heparinase II/III family protein [Kiritimatiellia bacterium]|jgi:hypothetical protein|nr:heparinase II/III family protein [Kiritimatiellia bacterium]MDP6848029.1 heparinase II/III family protein [Kiritimatiellia bacterium]